MENTATKTKTRDDEDVADVEVIEEQTDDGALSRQNTTEVEIADRERYEPGDLGEMITYSKHIVNSGLCPDHIKSPEDAMLVIQQGRELGLTVMQSLQNINVVKGQTTLAADMMKAIALSAGVVETWDYPEKSDQKVVAYVRRTNGMEFESTWTIDRAKQAGLTGGKNDMYAQYPSEMLRHRADAEAARSVFPDLLSGLYTPSEMMSSPDQGRNQRPSQNIDAPGVQESKTRLGKLFGAVKFDESAVETFIESRQQRDDVDELTPDYLQAIANWVEERSPTGGVLSKRRLEIARRLGGDPEVDWQANGHTSSGGWQTLNKRWRAQVNEATVGSQSQDFHESLKARHEVESFNDLTAAQLMDSIADLEARSAKEPDDGALSPRAEYIRGHIKEFPPPEDDQQDLVDNDSPAAPPPGNAPDDDESSDDDTEEPDSGVTVDNMDAWESSGTPRGEVIRLARAVVDDEKVMDLKQYIKNRCRPASSFRTLDDDRAQDAVDVLDCPPKKRMERISRLLDDGLGLRGCKQDEPTQVHQRFVDLVEPVAPDCLDDLIAHIVDVSEARLWENVSEGAVRKWAGWLAGHDAGTPRPASDLNGSPRRQAIIELLIERGVHEPGEVKKRMRRHF